MIKSRHHAHRGGTTSTAQETLQIIELAAFAHDRPACVARLQDGSACASEVEDGALEATLLVAVADAVAIATWRDAAVALDKNGAVSPTAAPRTRAAEVVSVGGGAASITCGPTDLLVAYADAVRVWAMVVDDKLGQVLLTPKRRSPSTRRPRASRPPRGDAGLSRRAQARSGTFTPTRRTTRRVGDRRLSHPGDSCPIAIDGPRAPSLISARVFH